MNKNAKIPSASELMKKIRKVETKLDEMRQAKEIMTLTGEKPDENDKRRESALILQLRKLKKMQDGKWVLLEKTGKPKGPSAPSRYASQKPAVARTRKPKAESHARKPKK